MSKAQTFTSSLSETKGWEDIKKWLKKKTKPDDDEEEFMYDMNNSMSKASKFLKITEDDSVPIIKLRNGTEVTAKRYKDMLMAITYTNRTQAETAAKKLGSGWVVYHWGRPFYVGKEKVAESGELSPATDSKWDAFEKWAKLNIHPSELKGWLKRAKKAYDDGDDDTMADLLDELKG